jgi:hypothetical protein
MTLNGCSVRDISRALLVSSNHAREPGARRWLNINNQAFHHPARSRRIWDAAGQQHRDAAATAGSVLKKNLRLAGVDRRQPLIDVPQSHAISIQLPHLK